MHAVWDVKRGTFLLEIWFTDLLKLFMNTWWYLQAFSTIKQKWTFLTCYYLLTFSYYLRSWIHHKNTNLIESFCIHIHFCFLESFAQSRKRGKTSKEDLESWKCAFPVLSSKDLWLKSAWFNQQGGIFDPAL